MENAHVLLVEYHPIVRRHFAEYLRRQKEIERVDEAADGVEALEHLNTSHYDLMLTDIVMPRMDGYTLMEEIRNRYMQQMPSIIVVSVLPRDDFVMRAINLGAKAYIVKPCEEQHLMKRIREVLDDEAPKLMTARFGEQPPPTIESSLSKLFLSVGIPAHIKGYQFLRAAVKLAVEDPDIIKCITKRLYPGVARQYDTTAAKVERAIRHAIEVAWNRGHIDAINNALGYRACTPENKPTNGEFIALIAEKLRMDRILNS